MDIQKINLAGELSPKVSLNSGKISANGAVVENQFATPKISAPTSITFTFDNSAGVSAKVYGIGDPEGLVAAVTGVTLNVADSTGSGVAGDVINNMLRSKLAITGFNYEASASAGQLSNNPVILRADLDGTSTQAPIKTDASKRNNQFNDKLLTVKFPAPVILDSFSAIKLSVNAGETVTFTLFIGGSIR